MNQPLADQRDSPLWRAVGSIIVELVATREIVVNTAPDYVISYICRELVAKKLVTDAAARPRPARGAEDR
ncbi:MAG TPA: hypothetical protein VN651_08125 [Gemmatimonadaceae bacterium]|nr:hypothetical protein [Gemmatimonadaceae bacterium]